MKALEGEEEVSRFDVDGVDGAVEKEPEEPLEGQTEGKQRHLVCELELQELLGLTRLLYRLLHDYQ